MSRSRRAALAAISAVLFLGGCAPLFRLFNPEAEKAEELQAAVRQFTGGYLHAHADEARAASLSVHPSLRERFVEDYRQKGGKATQVDLEKWSWAPDPKDKDDYDTDIAYTRLAIDMTNRNSIVVKRIYLDLTWKYLDNTWLITDGLFPKDTPAAN